MQMFHEREVSDPRQALHRGIKLDFNHFVGVDPTVENLSIQLWGLSEHHKLSCFLSGLMNEIHLLIRMLNSINLSVTFRLAKIQNEYLTSTSMMLEKLTTSMPSSQPADNRKCTFLEHN